MIDFSKGIAQRDDGSYVVLIDDMPYHVSHDDQYFQTVYTYAKLHPELITQDENEVYSSPQDTVPRIYLTQFEQFFSVLGNHLVSAMALDDEDTVREIKEEYKMLMKEYKEVVSKMEGTANEGTANV